MLSVIGPAGKPSWHDLDGLGHDMATGVELC
jgi:hypothetical protein